MRKLLVALGGLFLCLTANAQNTAVGSLTAQGADCTTAGACVTLQFEANDVASASIQLSGTFTATVQFEASSDKGTTWVAISGTPLNSSTAVTSATTANTWKFNVASITNIRARCSAWTSAPTVVIRSSRAVANAIGGGGAVYASGLGTINVIPKGTGANQLADSAITDNATTVTTTEPIALPAGAKNATSLQFTADGATSGWYRAAANNYVLSLSNNGYFGWSTASYLLGNGADIRLGSGDITGVATDLILRRRGAANLQLGAADANGTPVDQTISVQNATTGSDLPGGHLTIDAPLGTGIGAGAKTCLNRALMGVTGTTAQTATNAFCVGESKKLSNTSATATSLVNISVPSNSSAGVQGVINVSCNDGTNFDSETNTFFVSIVNKAGAMTVGTAQLGTPSTANNSGSCTTAITAVAGTNSVDIKVTPVIGTIVPTTVTGTVLSLSSYATGNVTIN